MPEKPRAYLVMPAAGAGAGLGHLMRCLRLARLLGPDGVTFFTARMDSAARALLSQEVSRFPARSRPRTVNRLSPAARWDLVIVDARRTTRGELEPLVGRGPVVCLDEGGEAATIAPFLIDTIPGLPGRRQANLASPAFLDLPRRARRKASVPVRSILVSFGGEDRDDLTGSLLRIVERGRLLPMEGATVVEGPLFGPRSWPAGIKVLRNPPSLRSHLARHDLLVTHFGMTAFEALASGTPVVLLNPTRYHERLGKAAGFVSLGVGRPHAGRMRLVLSQPGRLTPQVDAFNALVGRSRERRLSVLLKRLGQRGASACPVCARSGNRVIQRLPDRTYRRCSRCGTIALESFASEQKTYGSSYFLAEYKAQYGRTYLEDFASIKAACRPRVALISELLGKYPPGVVVDVGCAFGPFLAALGEAGLPGFGIDVSPGAVAWVRRRLGVPAVHASFETIGRASLPRAISALTMWYVLEHFVDTDLVLRKASSLLATGGVLAFSTPNGRGISARKSLGDFLRASPGDHFTIFSPRGLDRLLREYGFDLRKVRVTGHHPERFPGLLGRAAAQWRPVRGVLLAASRLFGLGDTFEAYAVKGER